MTLKRILPILSVLPALVAADASATPLRVTRGDAEAVFQAAFNGGWADRLHAETIEGAPADFLVDSLARITPAADRDGKHYCVLDWHVISVALVEGNRPGEAFTTEEIFDRLANRHVEFKVDGVLIETMRTPPKRTTNPMNRGFVEAFLVSEGQILEPDDLAVGQHVLTATGFRADNPPMALPSVTFFIDAPGTGVCGSDDALTFREVE